MSPRNLSLALARWLACALLLTAAAEARTPGFVGRQGTQIVNDGGPLALKGVNLGNWLFHESYVTGAPFDNDTWYDGLIDVMGTQQNVADFYAAWRAHYITEADIQRIKALGFNSVRVPFDFELFYDVPAGQVKDEGFAYFDALLAWCASAGVYVIPDMHGTPGGGAGSLPLFLDYYGPRQQQCIAAWRHFAQRYATHPWIAGYDLINEPVVENQADKWRIRDLSVRITTAIREVDGNHMIFAEGNYFASDFYDLDPRWDDNMAFSNHNYWTVVPNPQLATQVQLAQESDVPLWLGEFGENSNHWLNAQRRSVENHGIGWAAWPYKFPSERINAITWVARTAGYQAVLDYWNGAGPKPTPAAATAALLEMAQRTARAHCTDNMDVVDALLRADFHTASAPAAQHVAPGRVYAADYDYGAEGVASHDSVFQTTAQGAGHTNWNNGFLLRNDGVDLGFLYDNANRYYVGWTESGEWLRYTFVSGAGAPTLAVRYASPAAKQLHLEIDGANVTGTVTLPSSGGYGQWTTASIPTTANLAPGVHTLRVVFDSQGLDFYWLEVSGVAPPMPAAWTSADLGAPQRIGRAWHDAGTWTIAGGGADIFGTSDQGHFAAQDFTGDGTLIARVASFELTDGFAKAGIMWRESNAADAAYAFVFVGPNTLGYEGRSATGAASAGASYGPGSAPKWLKLTRAGNVFTAFASDDGAAWTQLGAPQSIAMLSAARAGLAVTAHNDLVLNTSTFTNIALLPPAWTNADIGAPGRPGGALFATGTGTWTVSGGGADIYGASDQFHYAMQESAADGALVARVASVKNTSPFAKAGVMMRSSTGEGSRYAFVFATPGYIGFETRTATGASATGVGFENVSAPVWLKLTRSGSTFIGWWSADGMTWDALGTQTLSMSATPKAGLAVTAHDDAGLNTSTFANVALTPFTGFTAWQHQHFTATQLGDPSISAPLADANGDNVKNLLAYAAALSPWTPATAANGALPFAANANDYLTLSFIRRKNAPDLTHSVEVSSNLANWNSGAAYTTQISVVSLDDSREQVTVRDNTPLSNLTRRVMRVRVTSP